MNRAGLLPVNFALPGGAVCAYTVKSSSGWDIVALKGGGNALIADEEACSLWLKLKLIGETDAQRFDFGSTPLRAIVSSSDFQLRHIRDFKSPSNKAEALAFAVSLRETRAIAHLGSLANSIYVEKLSRLLPGSEADFAGPAVDDLLLGEWLTGGARISIFDFQTLARALTWLKRDDLLDVLRTASVKGFDDSLFHGRRSSVTEVPEHSLQVRSVRHAKREFRLFGRPALETFFNDHILDIVENREKYAALGIDFPSAVILHGPPGCGKTFAVDELVSYLNWPRFDIDASSIASPYIHETSRKISEVFAAAVDSSPSVLVIDEMDAFLSERQQSGQHRVEEVAEFLRRIPEAIKSNVLVIAMTNRLEVIDPAILRRGRFDHIVKVDVASRPEIIALLDKLLEVRPHEDTLDLPALAEGLVGRPLSDVSYLVREGARLAAKLDLSWITQDCLLAAKSTLPDLDGPESKNKIGFV